MKRTLGKARITRWIGYAASVLALLAVSAQTAAASPGGRSPELSGCRTFEIAAGSSPTLKVVNANGSFEVTKKGRRVRVRHEGRELVPERLRREGRILKVVDDGSEPLLMLGAFPGGFGSGGQLVYSPDLDPGSLKARFGFDTKALDDDLAVHLGVEPSEGLLVTDVCAGSPAHRADLHKNDVILEMSQEGGPLDLSVLRAGRRLSLSIETRRDLRWPQARELEAYLARALSD